MRKVTVTLAISMMLCSCAASKSLVTASTQKGQVLGYFWGDEERSYVPFSDDGKGKSAIIATQGYVDGKIVSPFSGSLAGQLEVTSTTTNPKGIFAKYTTGSGHKDAPTALTSESQYVRIGGREYGINSYRGIGFGYAGDVTGTIQPVFIGYQETNIDSNTYGDAIIATRPNNQGIAPTPRLRVTSQGDIQAYTGYKPASSISLVTKEYVDSAVASAYQKGYTDGVAYGMATCKKECGSQ